MTGLTPPPGAAADPSDPDALAAALRAFLADPRLREHWRQHALARRERLRPWSETAREVLAALPVDARPGE